MWIHSSYVIQRATVPRLDEKSLEIMLRFLDKIEKETALEHSSTDVDEKEMYL